MRVLSAREAAAWDAQAELAGVPLAQLMDAAGRAAAAVLARRWPTEVRRGVLVAAGPGNNGGDGWVLARALHAAGVPVWVAPVAGATSALNRTAAAAATADGVRVLQPEGPWPQAGIAVDALLGTGASGPPRPAVAHLLDRLHDLHLPLIALDGPTGLDLGNGTVHGAARADASITFGGVRRGHLLARDESGDVLVVDAGHPAPDPALPWLVDDAWAAARLPALAADAHKGTRGRVVLVGGAPGMSGAVRLAARAALAAGAGYAHVLTDPETAEELRVAEPEVLVTALGSSRLPDAAQRELLQRADAVVLGPGLGRSDGTRELVEAVLERSAAVVVDADALTAFQGEAPALARAVAGRRAVLTPHPGEFSALMPALAQRREVDPWGAAASAARELGVALLLKGVPTVVAEEGRASLTIAAGTPGLGTGGSGDVLAGLVATLLAQGLDPQAAAALAAHALGRAGELAARRHTARSMRPADTILALPDVWRGWRRLASQGTSAEPPLLATLPRPLG